MEAQNEDIKKRLSSVLEILQPLIGGPSILGNGMIGKSPFYIRLVIREVMAYSATGAAEQEDQRPRIITGLDVAPKIFAATREPNIFTLLSLTPVTITDGEPGTDYEQLLTLQI